ncbi:MAG: hypothetical protein M1816_008083 [Peltula sp. TS41687]|nr:MAG: hypothetical protein M1816_008083 [Peltula sp. TS41687]
MELNKRESKCEFPSDAGLVAVTPGEKNAGWALSRDRACEPDSYCPYACPPGQLMAQWDPDATSYTYPQSQNGGLHCDKDGKIHKPFPDKPYCVDGTGSLGCKNKAAGNVTFCQTVLPGNEAMLIPTDVQDWAGLAVPDPSYWASTAAHYYINPPGTSPEEACVWGTKDNPVGNWSPYVAGANTDSNGQTFVKVGWNPVYLEPETPFRNEMPKWGVKIECEGDGCNGLPCAIDPKKHSVNQCSGTDTPGAGGATFCVVTVPKDAKANIVVFEVDGEKEKSAAKESSKLSSLSSSSSSSSSSSESPSPTPTPTSTESSSSSSSSTSESTTTSETSTSSSSSSTSTSTTSSSDISSTTTTHASSTTTDSQSSTTTSFSSIFSQTTTTSESYSSVTIGYSPHIFVKNVTSTTRRSSSSTLIPTSVQVALTSTPQPRKQNAGTTNLSTSSALGVTFITTLFTILMSAL